MQFTRHINARHRELFTFDHVYGDVHIFLIGRYRDLSGIDSKIQVTAIKIVGFKILKIASQFFTRVLVIFGVKGK